MVDKLDHKIAIGDYMYTTRKLHLALQQLLLAITSKPLPILQNYKFKGLT